MYQYRAKTILELEALADGVLKRHAIRVNKCLVDMEGIVEDEGISLLPRPGIKKTLAIDAYLPRNPKYLLIDEDYGADMPYFRVVIDEELSHRVLEPELWSQGGPAGANIYEIDKQIYDDIESNAYRMALALLMPRESYIERFGFHLAEATAGGPVNSHDDRVRLAIDKLSNTFNVTFNAVASRGNHIELFKGFINKKQLPGAVIL